MKLYELPRNKDVKIYGMTEVSWEEDNGDNSTVTITVTNPVIIFMNLDGAFSYCSIENHPDKIVHLSANLEIEPTKDGYRFI